MTAPGAGRADITARIWQELYRAEKKFPAGFHSGHEGWAVIKEELDELWEHVRADTSGSYEAEVECIQIAAMAIRFILCIRYGEHNV